MSTNKTDDVVSEYLHEIEARLGGLPLLQRRELLADLEAHIATERAERNVQSQGEVLEILERLGSPEIVAAAAYEEAGPLDPRGAAGRPVFTRVAARPRRPGWIIAAVAAAGALIFFLLLVFVFFASSSSSSVDQQPMQVPREMPRVTQGP
jgi:HAAS domain-containing protein